MNEQIKKDRELLIRWETEYKLGFSGLRKGIRDAFEAQARVTTAELIDELFEFSLPIEVVSFLQNKLSNPNQNEPTN